MLSYYPNLMFYCNLYIQHSPSPVASVNINFRSNAALPKSHLTRWSFCSTSILCSLEILLPKPLPSIPNALPSLKCNSNRTSGHCLETVKAGNTFFPYSQELMFFTPFIFLLSFPFSLCFAGLGLNACLILAVGSKAYSFISSRRDSLVYMYDSDLFLEYLMSLFQLQWSYRQIR
jgi:hypothetical protein